MTSNILKNFATATVAGALISFGVASVAVSFALIVHLTSGKTTGQKAITSVVSVQR
jgi:hypothetical protein